MVLQIPFALLLYSHPMQLLFFLSNDLIEAVRLDPEKISTPGYLGNLKRNLQRRYQELILADGNRPEFLVMPFTTTSSAAPQTSLRSTTAA